jgi:hypothetical protein
MSGRKQKPTIKDEKKLKYIGKDDIYSK